MTPYTVPIKPTNTPVMDLIQRTESTPLGDLIIALQVPPDAALWTLDADFAPLAMALAIPLYATEQDETKPASS